MKKNTQDSRKTAALALTAFFAAIIVLMSFTPIGYIPLGVINATIIHIPVILGAIYLGPKNGAFLGFVFGLTSFLKNTFMPATLSAFVFSPVLAAQEVGPIGVLYSSIICFVPRILVGIVPYYVYKGLLRASSGKHRVPLDILFSAVIAVILFFGLSAYSRRSGASDVVSYVIGASAGAAAFVIITLVSRRSKLKSLPYLYAGLTGAMTNTLLVMPLIYVFYREPYAAALSVDPDALISVILGIITFNGVMEAIVAAVITVLVGASLVKVRGIQGDRNYALK
ncbi:MAG: ECF transporter S component [Lachnospiraceae bacterium]|nr:ECF transporter S component [Lachnospiraceae bacterium]